MVIINESGLYRPVLTSRKEEAKRFKEWVPAEVIPAIRKTGGYQLPTAQLTGAQLDAANHVAAQAKPRSHEQRLPVAAQAHGIRTLACIDLTSAGALEHVPGEIAAFRRTGELIVQEQAGLSRLPFP